MVSYGTRLQQITVPLYTHPPSWWASSVCWFALTLHSKQGCIGVWKMFEKLVVQSMVGEVCISFMGINIGIEIDIVEHAHLIYSLVA
jgi:hypothetical protein